MMSKEEQLIDLIEDSLPIKATPIREILPRMKETWPEKKITLNSIFEIHHLHNMLDHGGVSCGITPEGETTEGQEIAFICSITHLKIVKGEPHALEIKKYQTKRIRKLRRGK